MQLRALYLWVIFAVVCFGCAEQPQVRPLSEIHLPDPERDVRRELGVYREVEFSEIYNWDTLGLDTLRIKEINSNGDVYYSDNFGPMDIYESYSYQTGSWVDTMEHLTDFLEKRYFNYVVHPKKMKVVEESWWGSQEPCWVIEYHYNKIGQVTDKKSEWVGYIFEFDSLGRLHSEIRYLLPGFYVLRADRYYMFKPVHQIIYYYRENTIFMDSVAQHSYDLDGYRLSDNRIKRFDTAGFPLMEIYNDHDTIFYKSDTR